MVEQVTIAVDAMGGDRAPESIVHGCLDALAADPALRLLLVGRPDAVEPLLAGAPRDRLEVVAAPDVVGMDESPGLALRRKPEASVAVCARLLAERRAQAVVSAGSTGALVAATLFAAKLLPGVARPGIAATFPTARGPVVLCDVGANIQPKPLHLLQYAVMASAFSEHVLGVERPRVGLLNIGTEEHKGSAEVRDARKLLDEAGAAGVLRFIGSVEGNHIFEGEADVVVCDGFVGNTVLKTAEGVGRALGEQFVRACRSDAGGDPAEAAFLERGLTRLERIMDWAETGGAPVLGVDGCVVAAHGRSDRRAIRHAVRVAAEFAQRDVNGRIAERLAGLAGSSAARA